MMKLPITILTVALLSAGCIQNIGDLRESLGATDEALEGASAALNEAAAALNETSASLSGTQANGTTPPVARMSLFAGSGALVYKSTFQADDPAEIVFVDEKSQLNAIAGDSEALAKDATLASFAWTLNGKAVEGAGKATVEIGEAGLYTLALTVTDSHGKNDTHTVKLGVAPKPFDVVTELVTGPVLGAEGQGESGKVSFDLALDDSQGPATMTAVKFTASPGTACDAILDVTDPNGESVGSADNEGNGGAEEITAGALPLGTYAIVVSPFACVEAGGVPVTVTVSYLPMVPGLDGGHGGHAGH